MSWKAIALLALLIGVLAGLSMLMYRQSHFAPPPLRPLERKGGAAAPAAPQPSPPAEHSHPEGAHGH